MSAAKHTQDVWRLYQVKLIHKVHDWDATLAFKAPNARKARKWALLKLERPEEWLAVRAALVNSTGSAA